MYLSNIKLWNFRKFGAVGDMDLLCPNLNLSFTKGLNVLIGENDSGKSAILEADDKPILQEIRAGMDDAGTAIDSLAKEYLKVTFLKPLRDAENELTAKKYSRLSQFLLTLRLTAHEITARRW